MAYYPLKTPCIQLYPGRGIAHIAILPSTEPKKDQVFAIGSGFPKKGIYRAKVEFPLLRLKGLPVNRDFRSIGVKGIQGLPKHPPILVRIGTGIMSLSPQHEDRFAMANKNRFHSETPFCVDSKK
jgi:hypothetical protein